MKQGKILEFDADGGVRVSINDYGAVRLELPNDGRVSTQSVEAVLMALILKQLKDNS
jgi:hypothetical protein